MQVFEIHALYCYFALNCFWTLNFGHNDGVYIHFCFCITLWLQCLLQLEATHLLSYAYRLIGFCVIWILWSKCIVFNLYIFYLFSLCIYLVHVLNAFIYLYYYLSFICCCSCYWSVVIFSWFIVVVLFFFLFVFVYCHLLVICCL